MGIEIRTGRFGDAAAVRRKVFVDEQGYEDEFDAIDDDPSCLHLAAYEDGELVGCARAFPLPLERRLAPGAPQAPACDFDDGIGEDEVYVIGRVAVLPEHRGRGLGRAIVRACDEAVRAAGAGLIKLHSQEHARGLYEGCGYAAISGIDCEDEGQPHLWMAKRLDA